MHNNQNFILGKNFFPSLATNPKLTSTLQTLKQESVDRTALTSSFTKTPVITYRDNVSKENLNKYFSTFYKVHELDVDDRKINRDISYNKELLASERRSKDYEGERGVFEGTEYLFREDLKYQNTYYEPSIYDEEIALQCDFTPFKYKEIKLLALQKQRRDFSCCGFESLPRLYAYRILVRRTTDKDSTPLCRKDYFEHVFGKEAINKVEEILNR